MDFAPSSLPVLYRTYSRQTVTPDGVVRENWDQIVERCVSGYDRGVLKGSLSQDERDLLTQEMLAMRSFPSGRWLWVGGTPWIEQPENFFGAYNCTSFILKEISDFGRLMELSMCGSGTGAMLEQWNVDLLPTVKTQLDLTIVGEPGDVSESIRIENTIVRTMVDTRMVVEIVVGDSRAGWVEAYQQLINLAYSGLGCLAAVRVNVSNIRAQGERLKGFGGVANPSKFKWFVESVVSILNGAVGRKLTPLECCKVIDSAAFVVVAGGIRRSAGMKQFSPEDTEAVHSKDNLWIETESGWKIDPDREMLRMSNHTAVFHTKPTYEQVLGAVRKQFFSGEGAIQYAPEALYRANIDLITPERRDDFLSKIEMGAEYADVFIEYDPNLTQDELNHRANRYGLNPCGEIIGSDFACNLAEVHLNQIDPQDIDAQQAAFKSATLAAAALLHQQFDEKRANYSRQIDPIVAVCPTGIFDYFVNLFGVDWLHWWELGRNDEEDWMSFRYTEQRQFTIWKNWVKETLSEYCNRHNLRCPNRFTAVQPSGTKALLTGASSGWHPPKAPFFLRRITFTKGDPVCRAALELGYSVVPSQSDRDEQGHLLDDPFDPRCTEWLLEIPTKTPWADLEGTETVDPGQFSAVAQFDFFMQVQRFYTTHNTSSTIELREVEIEPLAQKIYEAITLDKGYISSALLARFDDLQTFPRLPFEPISKARYYELIQKIDTCPERFMAAIHKHDRIGAVEGPAGCDSEKCLIR